MPSRDVCDVSAGGLLVANQFARDILPAVNAIRNAGTTSLQGISAALNKQGIRTARGKRWHVSSVANLLARAKTSQCVNGAGTKGYTPSTPTDPKIPPRKYSRDPAHAKYR